MVLLKCAQDAVKKGKIQVPFIGMAKCFLRKVDIAHKVVETDVENDNSIDIIFCQRIHAFFVFQKSTVVGKGTVECFGASDQCCVYDVGKL
jgi:hypothetical protein